MSQFFGFVLGILHGALRTAFKAQALYPAGQDRAPVEALLQASAGQHNASGRDARPYSLPWPLPSCEDGTACTNATDAPWEQWSEGRQMEYLVKLFPGSASRVVNVVSDECMIKSQLNFYGLTGPEWQTEGFSSHVDWGRADGFGHPGSYTRPMLVEDPAYIRRVRHHLAGLVHVSLGSSSVPCMQYPSDRWRCVKRRSAAVFDTVVAVRRLAWKFTCWLTPVTGGIAAWLASGVVHAFQCEQLCTSICTYVCAKE